VELEAELQAAGNADQFRAVASDAVLASVRVKELGEDPSASRALAILAIHSARKSGDASLVNEATMQYLSVRSQE
jgi:hypothetical protein